jgi:FkbM family methyltransferase
MLLNLLKKLKKMSLRLLSSIIFFRIIKNLNFSKYEKYLFGIFIKLSGEKFKFSESNDYLTIYGDKPTLYLASKSSDLDKAILIDKNFYLLDWVLPAVHKESIILDIGANTGVFGLAVANMFPQNLVFLFEPHQDLIFRLVENININKLKNATIVNKAVSDSNGTEVFYAQDLKKSKNYGLSTLNYNAVNDEIVTKIAIESIKLDTFVRDLNLKKSQKISFIKIDVQGAEPKVLAGAQDVIRTHRPIIIFEHEDKFYNNPMQTKSWLKTFFFLQGYKVMLISKNFPKVALPVDWSEDLEIDLIAIPTV